MVRNKSLLIIGAGASSEIDMPAGAGLKSHIAQLLNIRFEDWNRQVSGDSVICASIKHFLETHQQSHEFNDYLHTCWHICSAMPQAISIDNFIDNHRQNKVIELCGKLAIVRGILEAERKSNIYFEERDNKRQINYSVLESTWYGSFMQLLTENCPAQELPQRLPLLTFIIFNYDRCVEHFLYNGLQNYYGVSANEAADLVNSIEIYHPYGTVGDLPWQGKNSRVPFGAKVNEVELYQLSSKIKTFAEGTDEKSSDIAAIRKKLVDAKIQIYLGFAFHRQNMELLRPNTTERHAPAEYYATALGSSESDTAIIVEDLQKLLGNGHKRMNVRRDLKCADLFREYRRSLSLSFSTTE